MKTTGFVKTTRATFCIASLSKHDIIRDIYIRLIMKIKNIIKTGDKLDEFDASSR